MHGQGGEVEVGGIGTPRTRSAGRRASGTRDFPILPRRQPLFTRV